MTHSSLRYVAIYVRVCPEKTYITQVSNWIDVIEDIEEDPEAAQILSSYEGVFSYTLIIHSRLDLYSFQMRAGPMNLHGPSARPASVLALPDSPQGRLLCLKKKRLRLRLKLGVLRIRGLGCRVLCRVLGFQWSRQALLRLCQAEP